MKELSNSHIEKIISLLENGKPLPEHYKEALINDLKRLKHSLLFDTKKEYELVYADKEREEQNVIILTYDKSY
jgi:mRNA-degrading endonuclease YafQ of YafQ-DinJ toxin-antitoxin module